ncbi:MAG: acetyl-CoA carboxylase biotin carboxyl carrier protein, partial [Acidobacteria bacterium]|nr:acetyl-CoA carboxylase biotin carboxyl carrier protein [Acidobacteriota bacterium]
GRDVHQQVTMAVPAPMHLPPAALAPSADVSDADDAEDGPAESGNGKYQIVSSPFVGTFYRAPGPEAEPFVEVGNHIEKGQVLCIVEAMKLMNEIEAEYTGVIAAVLVENAQSVEYGQPLFKITPA